MTDFPESAPPRPLWLMTLADLALLLLGFVVLLQATAAPHRPALAQGLRQAFTGEAMPVASTALPFAPGSSVIEDPAALVAWGRDAARDPRVELTVTAATDGSAADVDPATGSAAPLAADRARAVAVALAPALPPGRLRLSTDPKPRGRVAVVTLGFAGEP